MALISSTAGLKGLPFFGPYAAAKHGVVGIMRTVALELGDAGIRVNSVHPTGVDTAMVRGLGALGLLLDAAPQHRALFDNVLPTPLVEVTEVSDVVLFLASPAGRHITGLAMTVDAGASL
jgi:NAD(P)-dependent dehydrogenase (short-subunit alcohol dehydrogenase family)